MLSHNSVTYMYFQNNEAINNDIDGALTMAAGSNVTFTY